MRLVQERDLSKDIASWRPKKDSEDRSFTLNVAGHRVAVSEGLRSYLSTMTHLLTKSEGPPGLKIRLSRGEHLPRGWFSSSDKRLVGSRREAISASLNRIQRECLVHYEGLASSQEIGKPLLFELIHWLRDVEVDVFHAACIARGQRGLLLGGKGGSGKTTTLLATLRNPAWKLLSDDYLAIDERLLAWSLYKTIWTDGDLRSHSPAFERSPSLGLSDEKSMSFHTHTQTQTQADLCGVIIPNRGRRSSLQRISSKQAFLALAPSTILLLPGDRNRRMKKLADITSNLPCWELELGGDPQAVGPLLEGCLCNEL